MPRRLGADGAGGVQGVRRAMCGEEVQGLRALGKAERMMDLGACTSRDNNERCSGKYLPLISRRKANAS